MATTTKKSLASRCKASIPTINRMPLYLQAIRDAKDDGESVISATRIARELDLEPIQVRKDLAVTGIIGKPRVGYRIEELMEAIRDFLHWDKKTEAVLIGAGKLGGAVIGYSELKKNGLRVVAAFDNHPSKVGKKTRKVLIHDLETIDEFLKETGIKTAILTVSSSAAQEVCDRITSAGITRIWNFSARKLKVGEGILVQKETLSSGYAVLTVLGEMMDET